MIKNVNFLLYLKTPKSRCEIITRETNLGEEVSMQIYFRITVEGIRAEISTGEFVSLNKWDRHKSRVKGGGEKARIINARLDTFLANAKRAFQYLEDRNKPVSALSIKNRMQGKDANNFGIVQCFENFVKEINLKVGTEYAIGTLRNYNATLGHLKDFILNGFQVKDYPLKDLNYKFITDFELMCKTNWGCKRNSTSVKHIQRIRKVVGIALANEWLEKDPFLLYKGKQDSTNIKFLTQEELIAIEEKEFSIDRLEKVRDIFIFSCYTGYSYSDVKKFTTQDLVMGIDGLKWIYTARTKNDNKSNVPLLPKALAIIEKYKTNPEVINKNTLLPVLSNEKTNSYLKEIADVCGIRKNLTFHMARHTFATTVTLTNGVPIETVSKMLGHKSLKTTQIYAKVVENKVSADMIALRAKLISNDNNLKRAVQRDAEKREIK